MKTTLDELQAFVRVVDSGSISTAAEQAQQTASGISRALSRLENKLGTTLLRRTTRRLELTEEGTAFLANARQILDAVEAAEEQVAIRRQRPSGRLRVNASTPIMLHILVPLIESFRARYPDIQLELDNDELYIDLLERQTDVAIRVGTLRDSTLHARSLGQSRLRVLASPAYLEVHGIPQHVNELSEHSLLGFTQPENLNHWPLRHELGDSFAVKPAIKASNGETLRQLALGGHGIVCLSDFMTLKDREKGELVELLDKYYNGQQQPIHAVYYRNTALAARLTCFLDHVQAWMSSDFSH